MKKINWIILSSEGRGIQYGVGTFIKQLSAGLARKEATAVYILKTGIGRYHTFECKEDGGVTILHVPLTEQTKEIDTHKNQEKIARSIVRVVLQYISPADINVLHMNYVFQYFIARELKQKLEGIVLFTQHVFTFNETYNANYFDLELETYQMADHIITVTCHGKDHLIAKGVSKNKIRVIYNGIDPKQFDRGNSMNIKEKYGLTKNEHLVLFSGRIDHIKGLDYLSSAFNQLLKQIPACRLVIAGDGNFELLIKATSHFSSHVSFLGFIPFEELVSLYHVSTIGVIPSLEEHCSYVALEMLFCGLPVVASKLGGLKEIFIHKENAFLTDMVPDQTNLYKIAPDVEQLAGFMYELLGNEPLKQKFSQSAVTRANAMFTRDKMVDQYLKLINELIVKTNESLEER
ncbi:MAG: glycosyltransferase family 4 protein [Mangrovibacterium sp.]